MISGSYSSLVDHLMMLLTASVARSIGDKRGVALQISGGLDSAVIQAIAGLDELYCCTWPEFDNMERAKLAAMNHPVREVTFTREEMIEVALPEVAKLTQGRGTWSQCCQWFLARAMAADGIKIELNGEGSDELFWGYSRYRVLYWLQRMIDDPLLEEYSGVIRHMLEAPADRPIGQTLAHRMLARTDPRGAGRLMGAWQRAGDRMLDTVARVDGFDGLPTLTRFEEVIAVAHGLEHRWPFLAPEIVAFADTLRPTDKIDAGESKRILRQVARELGVHRDIITETTKRGLVVPPTWAPKGDRQWSRGWFEELMREAWARDAKRAFDHAQDGRARSASGCEGGGVTVCDADLDDRMQRALVKDKLRELGVST